MVVPVSPIHASIYLNRYKVFFLWDFVGEWIFIPLVSAWLPMIWPEWDVDVALCHNIKVFIKLIAVGVPPLAYVRDCIAFVLYVKVAQQLLRKFKATLVPIIVDMSMKEGPFVFQYF